MKTLRISEDAHQKLTALLGELTAQTMRMQTYTDAIESLLSQSVTLPPELLGEIENFIEENKQFGFTTREELIRDAIRWRLQLLKKKLELIEIPADDYERLQRAIKEMNMPFMNVNEFVDQQAKVLLEKYCEWLRQKDEYEKSRRKSGRPLH